MGDPDAASRARWRWLRWTVGGAINGFGLLLMLIGLAQLLRGNG